MGGRGGKLKAAARWLVQPADDAADSAADLAALEADMRSMRVPEAQIQQQLAALREHGSEREAAARAQAPAVWAWHIDAVRLFGALRRQWRLLHMGQGQVLYIGLDLNALDGVRRMLRLRPRPELMDQLRTMESAAAAVLNGQGHVG